MYIGYMNKKCSQCNKNKDISNFSLDRPNQLKSRCKMCINKINREWRKNNPEKAKIARKKNYQKYRQKIKQEVFNHYGNKCACCGEKNIIFLTIDHINNDGKIHRKKVKTRNFYDWLRARNYNVKGLQTLCWNCNVGKRINYGICPHKN
jgi:hypothetical protein